ncbi:site-2 protease family protein, partial [Lawsonibacter sp. DFI.5.51]|nr:site-2 protease family protein [Lawsonibacter sp. DFI.5.51]
KVGVLNVLYLAAVISLNLGVLNLLPIPALDGGRLFFLFIEFLRGGKKIDPEKEGMVNLIGFGALMVFML